MQIYRSQSLAERWPNLPVEVKRFVESLRSNPQPAAARPIAERPGYYEILVAGYWIGWQTNPKAEKLVIEVGMAENFD